MSSSERLPAATPPDASLELARVPVAILAGGLARRLRPLTDALPKALVELAGRPFIEHQLALLRRRGLRRVVVCVGHRGEQIEARVGDGSAHGLEVRYARDGERLMGTAGALRRAMPLLGDRFFVLYGDSYLDVDYGAVLADAVARDAPALMTVLCNEGRWERSNVLLRDGRLIAYDKRQPPPGARHVDFGLAVLHRGVLARLPEDEPCDLADLYRDLAAEGRLAAHEVEQRFYEIGTPEGLAAAEAFLESRG